MSKQGWCYYHHFSGHATESCRFKGSILPDRKKQNFRCEVHESPHTRLSAALPPQWDEAIKEPKTLEDVLSLLHSLDAWIEEYFDFVQERDDFHLKILKKFLPDAQSQEELAAYTRLKDLLEHANICSETLVKSVAVTVKHFYSERFVPMVRECIQANVSAWKLDKNKEDDILAGSTSITELFSYLPRLYESCQTSLEVALASAPILLAGLFPIGPLRKEI